MIRFSRTYGIAVLVALLFCIYTFSNSGHLHRLDEASHFALTESLALRGEIDTNAVAWTQWRTEASEASGAFGINGDVAAKKDLNGGPQIADDGTGPDCQSAHEPEVADDAVAFEFIGRDDEHETRPPGAGLRHASLARPLPAGDTKLCCNVKVEVKSPSGRTNVVAEWSG